MSLISITTYVDTIDHYRMSPKRGIVYFEKTSNITLTLEKTQCERLNKV